jgi:hypothetical protein
MIEGARSFKQGQVSRDEAVGLLSRFRDGTHKARAVKEALEEIENYVGDLLVVSGDLHVPGDLDLMRGGAYVLVVDGDLTVDGVYRDYDDPESFLLVTGDLQARDVVTAGWLEVHGDLRCGHLIGDYNDCSTYIGGDVHARFFYGEEHFFTVGGAVHVEVVVGGAHRPRLDIVVRPEALPLDDARLLDHLDRELLRFHEDEQEDGTAVLYVDGIKDFTEIKRRVVAGIPLRTP